MANRVSQSQIAKDLGVSQSLVSLVLNGRRDGIADESYKMIWAAAREQGYVPRGIQPNHEPGVQHRYVGVVFRRGLDLTAQNTTFNHVHHGLFAVLQESNISTAFLGGEGDLDEKKLTELFSWRDPLQGIVVMGEVAEEFLMALDELQMKLIYVYASSPGLCHSIIPNDRQSVEQLADHLFKLGHRCFAWLGGNSQLARNKIRLAALKEKLNLRGLSLDERYVINSPQGDRQDGFDCASELLTRTNGRDFPTAWVCHNGLMARGALQAAFLKGIKIPDQVSVVAIDHTRVCTEIHPYLTSAGSDPEQIGIEAAKLLCPSDSQRTQNGTFFDLVVPSIFNEGETSVKCAG